jgi:UDP-N-acetylglucosamine--N-acetylmuramyl-(pentapeptide) pyrophosphoryl-undecaprenol N-acetylglucosamine transferase
MSAAGAGSDRPAALFAAGGTGGHIWPAIAVARELMRRDPRWECRFVSGDRPVEIEVYEAAKVTPTVFHVPKPSQGRWRTWLAMGPMILRARRLLRDLKPRVILSTGGYVAAPVAVAGWLRGVPTILLEPNAVPGRVTRRLAPRVAAVAVADPMAKKALPRARRVEVTGNPLPWSASDLDVAAARAKWGISDGSLCLLVVGGSQGAKVLNGLMIEAVSAWNRTPPPRPVHVLWMTGSANVDEVMSRATGNGQRATTLRLTLRGHHAPFSEALAAADLVVSRSGAGAVAEIAAAGLPSVLLPLPIALDDHQRANAKRLVDAGAAVVFDERSQGGEQLVPLLNELLADPSRLARMAEAARSQAAPEAANRVVQMMMELAATL